MKNQKIQVLTFLVSLLYGFVFYGCNSSEKKQAEIETQPQVFTPETSENAAASNPDSIQNKPAEKPEPITLSREIEKPDLKKLGQLTPNQEAKRALTNDAYKATKMSLTEFGTYMQTRIPYYKNKGDLKFENDIVRIYISAKTMEIQTIKGRLTYPMQ